MKLTVRIYGRQEISSLDLRPGATIADAVSSLGLDPASVGIAVLDEKIASEDTPLKEGDELALYPPLAGG